MAVVIAVVVMVVMVMVAVVVVAACLRRPWVWVRRGGLALRWGTCDLRNLVPSPPRPSPAR